MVSNLKMGPSKSKHLERLAQLTQQVLAPNSFPVGDLRVAKAQTLLGKVEWRMCLEAKDTI